MGIGYNIKLNFKNIPGKRIKRKFVVIECDDWGGIRMPSKKVYELLIRSNIQIAGMWNQIDTLADKEDLECLFDVLLNVKDKNGNAAVMTPVTNVANPDFEKIKQHNFNEYFYEPFTETLKKYGRHPGTFNTWIKGMEMGIFLPESHGREHLSVQLWLKKLREGDSKLRFAFDHGFAYLHSDGIHDYYQSHRPEFYFDEPDQLSFLKNSIVEGIKLFKDTFGYIPHAFVPSNGIFHNELEKTLASTGVKFLHVGHISYSPDGRGELKPSFNKVGSKTLDGLIYYTRNCAFEPIDPGYKGISHTIKQINIAFRWGNPAIISSHRVNFIGAIERENREKGLKELKLLLEEIVRRWPDVEFVSLGELLKYQYSHLVELV